MKKTIYSFGFSCLLLVSMFGFVPLTQSISAQTQGKLTNKDVIKLVKAGLSAEIISATIKSSKTEFDTSMTALQMLKKEGVPDAVILAMLDQRPKESGKTEATQTHSAFPNQQVSEQGKNLNPQSPVTNNEPNKNQSPDAGNLRPKRPGVPRIGIVTTMLTVPPEQDDAVRAQIYEMLYGNRETSAAEAVLLKEKLDRNIATEAKMTGCDYVLLMSLESTIKPASQKSGGLFTRAVQIGGAALGLAGRNMGYGYAAGITYRGYQIADYLQSSNTLLDMITEATEKKDKVGINFRLTKLSNNETVIPQTLKERIAQKKKEVILQNLLIEVGNQILNSVPNETPHEVKPSSSSRP